VFAAEEVEEQECRDFGMQRAVELACGVLRNLSEFGEWI
jgi:hypothetical protein